MPRGPRSLSLGRQETMMPNHVLVAYADESRLESARPVMIVVEPGHQAAPHTGCIQD
jgi:hypothetical protein